MPAGKLQNIMEIPPGRAEVVKTSPCGFKVTRSTADGV